MKNENAKDLKAENICVGATGIKNLKNVFTAADLWHIHSKLRTKAVGLRRFI